MRAVDPDAEPLRSHLAVARQATRVEATPAAPVAEVQMPLVHPPPRCFQDTLLDVLLVSAGNEAESRPDFVAVYDDGFAVNWSRPPLPGHRPRLIVSRVICRRLVPPMI